MECCRRPHRVPRRTLIAGKPTELMDARHVRLSGQRGGWRVDLLLRLLHHGESDNDNDNVNEEEEEEAAAASSLEDNDNKEEEEEEDAAAS